MARSPVTANCTALRAFSRLPGEEVRGCYMRHVLRCWQPKSIGPVAVLGLLLCSPNSWSEYESLEAIAKSDPTRQVLVQVSFHRIQRSPAIVDLMRDSSLVLEWIKAKNVGSGGSEGGLACRANMDSSIADTPERIEKALACREAEHVQYFRNLATAKGTYRDIDCPVDNYSAPTKDTHGIPGDYSVEAACGLRIVAIRVRGTAEHARQLARRHAGLAEFMRVPSRDEVLGMMEKVREQQSNSTKSIDRE